MLGHCCCQRLAKSWSSNSIYVIQVSRIENIQTAGIRYDREEEAERMVKYSNYNYANAHERSVMGSLCIKISVLDKGNE